MHFFHFYSCSSNLFCFFFHFVKTFSMDLKSSWNSVFFVTFFVKNFLVHIRSFLKLWSQTRKKQRQKSKNISSKCGPNLNFAPVKGSAFFFFVKFVVPYSTVHIFDYLLRSIKTSYFTTLLPVCLFVLESSWHGIVIQAGQVSPGPTLTYSLIKRLYHKLIWVFLTEWIAAELSRK